jgi:hypothetical protein
MVDETFPKSADFQDIDSLREDFSNRSLEIPFFFIGSLSNECWKSIAKGGFTTNAPAHYPIAQP